MYDLKRGLDTASDHRSIPVLASRRLVCRAGRYVANLPTPGCAHAVLVRSEVAHARLPSVESAEAMSVPGVIAVHGLAELEKLGLGRLPVGWVLPGQHATENDLLARDVVRYVGEPIAVVLAGTAVAAEDAAPMVAVAYDPLPAVVDATQALSADALLLHDDWGENVLARMTLDAGDCDSVFASAPMKVADSFRLGKPPVHRWRPAALLPAMTPFVTS